MKPKLKCKVNYENLTYDCKGKRKGEPVRFKGKFIRKNNGKLKLKEIYNSENENKNKSK